jgi:hypothetical protein
MITAIAFAVGFVLGAWAMYLFVEGAILVIEDR